MKKVISAILLILCFQSLILAQTDVVSKKLFDELWNKADSSSKIIIKTGSSTKDLNAAEKASIQSVDIKEKSNFNPNSKGIDTTNLEKLSTQPIVKGTKVTVKTKEAKIILPEKSDLTKKSDIAKEPMKPIVKEEKKTEKAIEKKTEKPVEKITETKKTVIKSNEDFSTQPVVKGKPVKPATNIQSENTVPKKNKLDTTKNFKEFTFETSPIVGNNASYNRKNEPMPKSKEQIEDEIPVNRKPNNTNINNSSVNIKEAYAQYDKEADSLHTANKRKLDSIMKLLNIKVPIVINPNDFIDIYIKGGGVVLNNDSKLTDNISILHTGLIQREYRTKNDGVQRSEKKISKDELTKLAQYIIDMGFFDFNAEYDCADEDAACNERLSRSPQPVPMQISLIVGAQKNKVNVSIFSPKTEKNWVNYPSTLEKIMNAIYSIVEK
jgi:hypothetical protein